MLSPLIPENHPSSPLHVHPWSNFITEESDTVEHSVGERLSSVRSAQCCDLSLGEFESTAYHVALLREA